MQHMRAEQMFKPTHCHLRPSKRPVRARRFRLASIVSRSFQSIGLDGSAPDAWRYMVEVQDLGKPPDTARYR
jgi:hypothetical protein